MYFVHGMLTRKDRKFEYAISVTDLTKSTNTHYRDRLKLGDARPEKQKLNTLSITARIGTFTTKEVG